MEKVSRFYYTFGSSDQYPFNQEEYVMVEAYSQEEANQIFRKRYPDYNAGVLNCAFCYTEEQFLSAKETYYSGKEPAAVLNRDTVSLDEHINRYMDAPKPVYEQLLALVKDKDYFVITTNVDHCFQKAGFDKERLFYTQGDYGLFQCSEPCTPVTYDNEEMVRSMVERQSDMRIPSELIPKCPNCGKPLTMNLRSDDKFVEDEGWDRAAERYNQFLRTRKGKILYLELGVGYNTPGIIKFPFWQMTAKNPDATYACVNYGETMFPEEIQEQAISIDSDIGQVIEDIGNMD